MSDDKINLIRASLIRRSRWGIPEILFWVVAAGTLFLLPDYLLLLNEMLLSACSQFLLI